MSSSDENQDLQTYLDSFNKEVEQSDDCLSLSREALSALSEADAVTQKILQEDAATDDDIDEDDDQRLAKRIGVKPANQKGLYYLETSGNKKFTEVSNRNAPILPSTSQNCTGNYNTSTKRRANVNTDNQPPSLSTAIKDGAAIFEFEDDSSIRGENNNDDDDEDDTDLGDFIKLSKVEHVAGTTGADTVHECPHCSYKTVKRFLLSRHMKTHSDDRPYKCSVCERGFKAKSALMNHVNTHLGNKPHACSHCEKRFNTAGELLRHVRYKHTGERPHKCAECDYTSVELSKMRRHMRCHTGERPYQCPYCTYASPDTFKLKRHLRTHTGEKPYECDICSARFTQSNSLKAHRLIHSVGDRPVFQCSLCPTTCGRKTDLHLHMRKLHQSDHPIKCKRCDKELPDRYTYKVHVKTHEGEKCFRCNVCPYASISQRHLDIHMLVHTDEKPFVCEQCGASFRQRQLLLRHMNIYHNSNYVAPTPLEKTHICPHCKRPFNRKGNLMRHMEMHDALLDTEQEKLKLKIGRKVRIQPDGTVSIAAGEFMKTIQIKDNFNNKAGTADCEMLISEGDDDEEEEADDDDDGMLENFEIIETIDDDGNCVAGNNDNVIEFKPLISIAAGELMKTIQIKDNFNNKAGATTVTAQQSNKIVYVPTTSTIKPQLDKVKIEQPILNDDDVGDDDNFVVIEVVDGEGADDETNVVDEEFSLQATEKPDILNSFGFTEDEYTVPTDVKPSAGITIMDIIEDD